MWPTATAVGKLAVEIMRKPRQGRQSCGRRDDSATSVAQTFCARIVPRLSSPWARIYRPWRSLKPHRLTLF